MPVTEDQDAMTSVLTVRTNRSAKQFAHGHRGGICTVSIPAPAKTASNDCSTTWNARTGGYARRGVLEEINTACP